MITYVHCHVRYIVFLQRAGLVAAAKGGPLILKALGELVHMVQYWNSKIIMIVVHCVRLAACEVRGRAGCKAWPKRHIR